MFISLFISSLLLGFGIPSFSQPLALAASLFGLVPLLYTNRNLSFSKRFWRATCTLSIAYAIQLSWFCSHPYAYIYPAWILLSLFLAMQLALPLAFLSNKHLESPAFIGWIALAIALIEYGRHFVLCGFSLYPLGLSLTAYSPSRLSLIYLGMNGLTFILVFAQGLLTRAYSYKVAITPAIIAVFLPYFFGAVLPLPKTVDQGQLRVGVIDTNEPPDIEPQINTLLNAAQNNMYRLIQLTGRAKQNGTELLITPEVYIPFSPDSQLYPFSEIRKMMSQSGLSFEIERETNSTNKVLTTLEALSEVSRASQITLIVGLEGRDTSDSVIRCFNSAYIFYPTQIPSIRYDKQALVPLGEYIPFDFLQPALSQYGILGAFEHGKTATIFPFKQFKLAPTICYEETFSTIVKKQKRLGADIIINVTNDNWFPDSRLQRDHFEHARIISTELGTSLIRACNMGLSAITDEDGNEVPLKEEARIGTTRLLIAQMNVRTRTTPFEIIGNKGSLLILLCFCIFMQLIPSKRAR